MDKKVRTLKDNDFFKDTSAKNIIYSQQISSFQFYNAEKKYYVEVGISKRAMIPKINSDIDMFDIAAAPSKKEEIGNAIKAILKERALSDIRCANVLLAKLKEDGIIDDEIEITNEDYADILNTSYARAIEIKKKENL